MFNVKNIVRKNIKDLKPYSSARDEFKGKASVYLDANENNLCTEFNRYPDPLQVALKEKIATLKNISPKNIFLGNGSDECIDLLYRCFCTPGKDNVIICPPTYGMYEVSANINDVAIRFAPLTKSFRLDTKRIQQSIDENTKLIWICSPNNPTGNLLDRVAIAEIASTFHGIVVVDEAYIDFAKESSWLSELHSYPNVVVMQTFSKAWGLAALRLGMACAEEHIIDILNKVKPPYNINQSTQDLVIKSLANVVETNNKIEILINNRTELAERLLRLPIVREVFPSDTNFLLVRFDEATKVYQTLLSHGIVVRNRSNQLHCENCLRITIGTKEENDQIIDVITKQKKLN